MQNWYKVHAQDGASRICIHDDIGAWGITAKQFYRDLVALQPKDGVISVHVNSVGGSVFDAVAIYNMLRGVSRDGAQVHTFVDGVAASAASLIVLAGDRVHMPSNALMMVHLPAVDVYAGTAPEMRAAADFLDSVRDAMLAIYCGKTGLATEKMQAMLEAETWLTASQAKELGFIDEITSEVAVAAKSSYERFTNMPPLTGLDTGVESMNEAEMNAAIAAAAQDAEAKVSAMQAEMDAMRKADEAKAAKVAADATEADKVKAEAERIRSIVEACNLARMPEAAQRFIEAGVTVSEAKSALLHGEGGKSITELATAGAGVLPRGNPQAEIDPAQVYARFNRKVRK